MSDEEFVETAIVSLLRDRGFRICYHREDFTPGQWIGDNIADATEKSRRMIFIVSRYECIVCLNITIIFTHNLECQVCLIYVSFVCCGKNDMVKIISFTVRLEVRLMDIVIMILIWSLLMAIISSLTP